MKNKIVDHSQPASGLFRSNFRRYFKRGRSPQLLNMGFIIQKSNQQSFLQIESPPAQNLRYSQKSGDIKLVSTELPKRQNSLLGGQDEWKLKQKKCISEYRKKDQNNICRKVNNNGNHNSSLFFQKGPTTTKQVSKSNSYSELCSLESKMENQIEELHYKMVVLQQKCKNLVGN